MIQVRNNEIVVAEELMAKMAEVSRMKLEVESFEQKLKDELKKAMEEHGVKKFENEILSVTYVAPTTRKSLDSNMIKTLYPEIAESCIKTSEVKSSVRLSYK